MKRTLGSLLIGEGKQIKLQLRYEQRRNQPEIYRFVPFLFLGLMDIDLNAIHDAVEEHPCSNPSSSAICLELWHACAGPLISLPRKGSYVVYFPQGHLEQMADCCPGSVYDLPPHVVCRVIDVKLHVGSSSFLVS